MSVSDFGAIKAQIAVVPTGTATAKASWSGLKMRGTIEVITLKDTTSSSAQPQKEKSATTDSTILALANEVRQLHAQY